MQNSLTFVKMKHRKRLIGIVLSVAILAVLLFMYFRVGNSSFLRTYKAGDIIDSLNGVYVYYEAEGGNTLRVDMSEEGFVSALDYPSEEFVIRYYRDVYNHIMPDISGHPRDFYDKTIPDGGFNQKRGLIQYANPGNYQPRENDILVYTGNVHNRFGHLAIVSKVSGNKVHVIQQNTGKRSRSTYVLSHADGRYEIKNSRVLGWLRKEPEKEN